MQLSCHIIIYRQQARSHTLLAACSHSYTQYIILRQFEVNNDLIFSTCIDLQQQYLYGQEIIDTTAPSPYGIHRKHSYIVILNVKSDTHSTTEECTCIRICIVEQTFKYGLRHHSWFADWYIRLRAICAIHHLNSTVIIARITAGICYTGWGLATAWKWRHMDRT